MSLPSVSASQARHNNPLVLSPRALPPANATKSESAQALRCSGPLKKWWSTLLASSTSAKYFGRNQVLPNNSEILCPDNESTIRINANSPAGEPGKPIHASHFEIERTIPKSETAAETQKSTQYRIGQSPPEKTCMDFLVAGLESGLGLFQFVSERTHMGKASRSNTAVVQLLEKNLNEIKDNGGSGLALNDRFTLQKIQPVTQESDLAGCRRFHLTVTDKYNLGHTITVPVTQAGLPFGGAVLTADSIASASAMMDQHRELLKARSNEAAHDPLILSHAGYGRNATLMTYREQCLRIEEGIIKKVEDIEQQVCEFIQTQRKIRPGFVHSLEQVEQLVIALEGKLRNHQEQSSQLVVPTKIHHARSKAPVGAVRHLSVVRPSAAPTPLIGTSSDKNLESMQVEGIAVSSGTKFERPEFEMALGFACERFKAGRNAEFERIGTQSPRLWGRARRSSASAPQHVLVTGLPPKDPRDPHPYLPHQVMKFIDQTLTAAAKGGLKSVGFAASLLEPTTPKPRRLGIPFEQMAALAVAAVDRHAARSSKHISVTFQCTNEAHQVIIDDVIAKREQFKEHQNLQALLRLPNNMPTPIPATALEDFGDSQKRASFAPGAIGKGPNDTLEFCSATALPEFISQSHTALAPWTDVPTTQDEWQKSDVKFADEPSSEGVQAAGVVIEEDDGRVWVVAPTGGYAGMKNTFPKGQTVDDDRSVMWSPQATARKEAYEESGLQVELTGFICDYQGRQKARYYSARRIGGTPADVGWESQAVHLVPKDQLRGMMTRPNNKRENHVLRELYKLPHDESGALTRLEELLCNPDCDVNGPLFDDMAQEVSEALRYRGQLRQNLVEEKDVHSRQDSCQPQKSTSLEIPGTTANSKPYLHANRIELDVSRKFIAAQYPLSSKSTGQNRVENRDDFWGAAVASNVTLVVDLTQIGEKKRDYAYTPSGKKILALPTYNLQAFAATPHQVANKHISDSIIQLTPKAPKQGEFPKKVRRMHFTQWKDATAIEPEELIDLANHVNQRSNPGDTVLIHCSHGVGRTGTLISFLAASEKIEAAIESGTQLSVADFLGIVRHVLIKGREARGEQYVATVQFPLVVKALLKKHFESTTADGMLIPKTHSANVA